MPIDIAAQTASHPLAPFHRADVPPSPDHHVARGVWTFTDALFRPVFRRSWAAGAGLESSHGLVRFHPLPDVAALLALLALLKGCPDTCIMSGQYRGASADTDVYPPKDPHGRAGQPKRRPGLTRKALHYWSDEPNCLFRVDVDGHPAAGGWDAVLDLLPEALSDAALVVSPSSKAGAPAHLVSDPTALRGHVFALLAEPRTLAEQATWVEVLRAAVPSVDASIYQPSRLLRTAAPDTAGYPDPLAALRGPTVSRGAGAERAALPATPPGVPRPAAKPATIMPAAGLEAWNAKTPGERERTIADLRDALRTIPADDYHDWIKTLMQLRAGLPSEIGLELADEYSRKSANFTEDALDVWDALNPSQTGYAAVFKRAEDEFKWLNPRRVAPRVVDAAAVGFGQAVGERAVLHQPVPESRALPANLVMIRAVLQPTGIDVRFDRFTGREIVVWEKLPGARGARPLEQDDMLFMREHLQGYCGFKPIGSDLMADAVRLEARAREYDAAIEWLHGLPAWDGVPRVAGFVSEYLGAEPGAYAQAVGQYFWTAAAGRVLHPGVKADCCVVLVGPQGLRKSSAIAALAPGPDYFGELDLAAKREDRIRMMRGKLIVELPELAGLNRREVEEIKAFMSSTTDEFTEKFQTIAQRNPRRCVFVGSTNEPAFLSDATGNRRWLPIELTSAIDVDRIRRDRDHLWAEGASLFRTQGVMFAGIEGIAAERAAAHTASDPWDDQVATWLAGKRGTAVSAGEVLRDALYIPASQAAQHLARRVGHCIRRAGWVPRTVRTGNRTGRKFVCAEFGA